MSQHDTRLEGRVALVTGGASGIGAACAKRLAQSGASVLVTDVDQSLGEQVVAQIQEAGGKAQFASHDVTDETQWKSVVSQCQSAFGGMHVLVNNAGIAIDKDTHWTALTLVACFKSFDHAPTARSAASIKVVARIMGNPDCARIR